MDTARDSRVLLMEDAVKRLGDIVTNRRLKIHMEYSALNEILSRVGPLIYEIKYSYVEPRILAESEPTGRLVALISDLDGQVRTAISRTGFRPKTTKEQLTLSEFDYAVRMVSGFQRRLRECPDDPAYAVDLLNVEISQVRPVEGSSKLSHCRCTDGSRIWNIVTNMPGLKTSLHLACAVLPPVEMMDVVSEAMFLGSTPVPPEAPLGLLKTAPAAALDQARAQVMELTRRLMP